MGIIYTYKTVIITLSVYVEISQKTSRSQPLSLVLNFSLDPGLYSVFTVAGRDVDALRPALRVVY